LNIPALIRHEFDTTKKIFTNPSKQQTEDYVAERFG
jgi:ABC-type phosphate transport system ATPase subunit